MNNPVVCLCVKIMHYFLIWWIYAQWKQYHGINICRPNKMMPGAIWPELIGSLKLGMFGYLFNWFTGQYSEDHMAIWQGITKQYRPQTCFHKNGCVDNKWVSYEPDNPVGTTYPLNDRNKCHNNCHFDQILLSKKPNLKKRAMQDCWHALYL